jgi:hypothetical protein
LPALSGFRSQRNGRNSKNAVCHGDLLLLSGAARRENAPLSFEIDWPSKFTSSDLVTKFVPSSIAMVVAGEEQLSAS